MGLKLKKGDKVQVLAGKDRGKTGKVLKLFSVKSRAIVEGVNLAKKHMRRRSESEPGGIKEVPTSIHVSNLALVCPQCGKGTRFGVKVSEDKSKAKVCKRCQQAM